MALHTYGNRIVVTHNLVTQRVVRADLIEDCVFAACADFIEILVTLSDNRFPNKSA